MQDLVSHLFAYDQVAIDLIICFCIQ